MKDLELFNETKLKMDKLFECCADIKDTHPYAIVMIMHDLARNIYPSDPYIALEKSVHRLDYMHNVIDEYIATLSYFKKWG